MEELEITTTQQVFGFKVTSVNLKNGKIKVQLEAETDAIRAGELGFGDVLKSLSIMDDADVEVPINIIG